MSPKPHRNVNRAVKSPKSVAIFWSHVERRDDECCWEWSGSLTRGYGQIGSLTTTFLAHRFSYAMHNGPVPSGMCVLHRCDNRACVNPAHLFLGTIADNNADAVAKGRARVGFPGAIRPHTILRGRANRGAMTSLDDAGAFAIRSLAAMNAGTHREIAKEFGVSRWLVWAIANGKKWKHVGPLARAGEQ